MPSFIALSPHLDDAAFSCGATLARLAAEGWQGTWATVFTASVPNPTGFALACQLDKGLPADLDYMALRREEDAAAAAALGLAAPRFLPFREAPHRGYESAKTLFGATLPDDAIVAPVAVALAGLLDETRPDLVLAPQAIGGHVDHVQLVRALDEAELAAPVLWWRDFPYTVREASPPEPFRGRMAALPEVEIRFGATAFAAKRAACAAYASQIGFQFGGLESLDRRLAAAGHAESFRVQGRLPASLAVLAETVPA
ncbi:MAG TPA: PIG-L family deacetylase [Beijerinckiaceae bacterium]|jgi:LmbE family N-acetylglucosaminyl deacetylase